MGVSVALSTIGGVGMWSFVVALPAVQADFGLVRADASLPYTLTMLGFAFGGVILGRLGDRHGILVPLLCGALALSFGYIAAAYTASLWQLALLLHLVFDGLASLYVISALFGLFQGGIVPSYAIIIREFFPAREIGTRLGVVIMATLFGVALGGWLSGEIFDLTGSYRAAFANGLAWNLVNLTIMPWLLLRGGRTLATA